MKRLVKMAAMAVVLLFWGAVVVAFFLPLPSKLNTILPICGAFVLLMHWLQAAMIKRAGQAYIVISKGRYVAILIFGVFALSDIRQQLNAILANKQNITPS